MSKLYASQLTAVITHTPEHYHQNCQALILEYWEAEVETTKELREHWIANNVLASIRVYGESSISAKEAFEDLKDKLEYLKVDVETFNVIGDWVFPNSS